MHTTHTLIDLRKIWLAGLALLLLGALFFGLAWAGRAEAVPPGPYDWQQASRGLPQDGPWKLFFAPGTGTVFATSDLEGTYRAQDRASEWVLLDPQIKLLAVSPNFAQDRVLIGERGLNLVRYLMFSDDAGLSWQIAWQGVPGESVVRFSPDYAHDQTVFLSVYDVYQGGVWRSTDGGRSWNAAQQLLIPVQAANTNYGVKWLAVSPTYAADNTLWAGTNNEMLLENGMYTPYSGYLYRSQDRGQTWEAFGQGAYDGFDYNFYDVKASPTYAADHTLWAVSEVPDSLPDEGLLWTSTDAGQSWSRLAHQPPFVHGLDETGADLLAFSPAYAEDQTLYFSGYEGIARSTDNGGSWQEMGAFHGFYNFWSYIAPAPKYPWEGQVFITVHEGLLVTDDGGSSFEPVEITGTDVQALAISPDYANDHTLWSGFGGVGLYVSGDEGESWAATTLTDTYRVYDIAASPNFATDRTLWAATADGMYRSTNGGDDFFETPEGLATSWMTAVEVSPNFAADHTLWAGTDVGIYRSTDGGDHWQLGSGMPDFWKQVEDLAVSPDFANDQTVFGVMRQSGVFRSTDGGASWQPVGLAGESETVPVAVAVAVSPNFAVDHALWAGTQHHGVYVSTNGGTNWTPDSPPLEMGGTYNNAPLLATGDGDSITVWAAGYQPGENGHGVYSSTDGGPWEPRGPDLPNWRGIAFAYDPQEAALFVGVEAGGVWRGSPPATAQRTDTINASGGEITSWGGDVTLIFPAGAVNTDTQISLRVLYGGPLPLENRLWIKGVELSASQGGTPLATFDQPVVVRFNYAPEELGPLSASSLQIFHHSGDQWTLMSSDHDAGGRTIQTQVDHFSQVVLVAEGSRLFLPGLQR
jgi:photosystem II stability/assembly factor-like uncharacterized protein